MSSAGRAGASSFERIARDRGFLDDALLAEVAATGTVRGHPGVPADVQRAFVTALEVAPRWHVRMQAAVQGHVDAAVSKTVNLVAEATPANVEAICLEAWRAGCKGITLTATAPGRVRCSSDCPATCNRCPAATRIRGLRARPPGLRTKQASAMSTSRSRREWRESGGTATPRSSIEVRPGTELSVIITNAVAVDTGGAGRQ